MSEPDGERVSGDGAMTIPEPATLYEALGTPGALVEELADELAGQPPSVADGGRSLSDEPVTPMVLDELQDQADDVMSMRDMRMLADIDVEVTVEFGRARLELRDMLSLRRGSLVELSRGLDQPVGILANNALVAYGEIVMVGDRFGVHVQEIVDPADRGKSQRLERTAPGVARSFEWAADVGGTEGAAGSGADVAGEAAPTPEG